MQKIIYTLIASVCISWALSKPACGDLWVSNLDQFPIGSAAVGSDFWIAQSFYIDISDSNQYALDAVQLLMNPAVGSPDGFAVSIFSAPSDGPPQDYLGSLAGPATPVTGGIYTYTASGITLPGTGFYFALVTSSTSTNQGTFNWSASDSFTQNGSWYIGSVYYTSSDGLNWQRNSRDEVFQMAVYATIVPEPATGWLLGVGLLSLSLYRRRLTLLLIFSRAFRRISDFTAPS